jgi:hypothetical protein
MTRFSSIFSQLLQLFPRLEFEQAVKQHQARTECERLDISVQNCLKRFRCQTNTVSGRTITKADLQSFQSFRRQTQNSRSLDRILGRGTVL